MKERENLQEVMQRLMAKRVGLPKFSSLQLQGNIQNFFASDLLQKHAQEVAPVQDLDPNSGTYGKFYFVAGYSVVGGDDIIG